MMTKLYDDKDYETAYRLKRKLLAVYLAALTAVFAACAVVFVLFLLMPYASTPELKARKDLYMFIDCALSVLFAIYSVIYICIPYRRARFYFKMLDDMRVGEKTKNVATFLRNDETITEVRFVDFRTMVVLEWSEKTQEYMRRNVLVDKEKPMPDFKSGDIITYETHANMLVSYGLKSDDDVFGDL